MCIVIMCWMASEQHVIGKKRLRSVAGVHLAAWHTRDRDTNQGHQYTTAERKQLLADNHIRISMDGRGRCKDYIWVERFLRAIKQEYIKFATHERCADSAARDRGLGKVYNEQCPQQFLQGCIPARIYQTAA